MSPARCKTKTAGGHGRHWCRSFTNPIRLLPRTKYSSTIGSRLPKTGRRDPIAFGISTKLNGGARFPQSHQYLKRLAIERLARPRGVEPLTPRSVVCVSNVHDHSLSLLSLPKTLAVAPH